MLIRYFHTGETAVWENWEGRYVSFWALASVVLMLVDFSTHKICKSRSFRRRPYRWQIGVNIVGMAIALLSMAILTQLIAVLKGSAPASQLGTNLVAMIFDAKFYVAFAFVLLTVSLFGFVRLMKGMIGDRVLRNLVIGRYHQPRSEVRVFMFIDLKSSTTHAERLGHELFSRLIQDCFADITESATDHEAEIYQYVGDEIILTWDAEQGARNGNCINVFFDYQDALERRGDYYQQRYGFVPAFKAGISFGAVTVIEVGVLKRDIAYLSDVLNTAARIEGECNKHHQWLMISASVRELVGDSPGLQYEEIGALELRGKDETVVLFGVQRQSSESQAR